MVSPHPVFRRLRAGKKRKECGRRLAHRRGGPDRAEVPFPRDSCENGESSRFYAAPCVLETHAVEYDPEDPLKPFN